jgi:hypothetical protein
MRRRGFTFLLSTTVLVLSVAGAFGLPAPARAAVDLRVCGKVTAYVPATALTAGVLTVGGVPLVIAAGADLSSKVKVGANLCLALDLDLSGKITDAVVRANLTSTLTLCGVVTTYARAGADTTGVLTVGGRKLTLAAGSSLPAAVKAGADLCLNLKLNGFGQVQGGTATVNATSTLRICGTITAYARATSTSAGSITVAGRALVLAAGSHLPAQVAVGERLCLIFTLNALGQVQDATVKADVQSALEACGQVDAVVNATDTTGGSLTLAGTQFAVRAATDLSAQIRAGAFVRLRLMLDAFGRVADATVLKVGTSLADACQSAEPSAPEPSTDASAEPSDSESAGPSSSESPAVSPSASVLPGIVNNPDAPGDDGAGMGRPGSGQEDNGIVPDTASLARTATVVALSAVPFLVMLAGIAAFVALRRRNEAGEAEVRA